MEQVIQQSAALQFDKKKSKFTLSIAGQVITQNVCEFLLTSSYLVGQNIEEFLLDVDSRYDTVKIPLTMSGKNVTVDLAEFARLRELYNNQMYMLKLEDLLLHRGIALPA